jgi:hypothetical protein
VLLCALVPVGLVAPVLAVAIGLVAAAVGVIAFLLEPQPLASTANTAARHIAKRGTLSTARAY